MAQINPIIEMKRRLRKIAISCSDERGIVHLYFDPVCFSFFVLFFQRDKTGPNMVCMHFIALSIAHFEVENIRSSYWNYCPGSGDFITCCISRSICLSP